jgi:conjugal transfer pilus assembly protein TrbC
MRLLKIGLLGLLATAGISAIAQTIDGQDIEAIRKRAAAMNGDATALVEHVKDRGDQFRREAAEAQTGGTENMRRVAASDLPKGPPGSVDFDEIVKGAATNAAVPRGDAPQFIVFASLSMPAASLKTLIADTARAGGVVVFRGFPDNSAKAFVAGLTKVVARNDMTAIGVDPRLFRAFDVQAVPTYVAVSSDFDLCAGFDCQTKLPPYDRMTGNVSVEYALSSFADGRGPGARVAAVALGNIRRAPQP